VFFDELFDYGGINNDAVSARFGVWRNLNAYGINNASEQGRESMNENLNPGIGGLAVRWECTSVWSRSPTILPR